MVESLRQNAVWDTKREIAFTLIDASFEISQAKHCLPCLPLQNANDLYIVYMQDLFPFI